jgi:hypothetical protein
MKKFRWNKRSFLFGLAFFLAFVAFLISEGILQANTLAAGKKDDQPREYARLVDWLPKSAKLAVEYRAQYLDRKEKMENARDVDTRVEAMFNFADYIKVKDKKGSDAVLAEVALNPEYRKSRRAYKSLARLLLGDNPQIALSIKDYHQHIDSLDWDEDKLAAWNAGRAQLNTKRVAPRVHLEYLAPLLENKMIYTNFDNFYANIQTHANKLQDEATVQKATAVRDEIKKARRGIPNAIIQAPLDFRTRYAEYKKSIEDAKDADIRLSSIIGLASLLFDKDNGEASRLLAAVRNNPEYVNSKNYYAAMARMLLEKRVSPQVTIAEYHDFLKTLKDPRDVFMAWEAGLGQLSSIKASPAVFVNYLKPLGEQLPEYRDYLILIEQLQEKAVAAKDEETAKKAETLVEAIKNSRDIRPMHETMSNRG